MREFDLGDILSVTTGILLSPRGWEGLQDLVNYMLGSSPYTLGMIAGADICAKSLLEQYPQLAEITIPKFDDEQSVWLWLGSQHIIYGKNLPVASLGAKVELPNDVELLAMANRKDV